MSDEAAQQEQRARASSGMRKELDMLLTAYLPAVVRRHLEKQDTQVPLRVPNTHQTTVVSMFADVSGFTAMTESLAARGPVGAEYLAKHLNSYFEQLLRLVSSAGGDVFKFAGDAMLIFWPENKEDTLESLLRRAIQCALRIQAFLHKAELAPGVVLSVKMGIGIGPATIAHLGGESDGAISRIEYIAVGPALQQAFDCEHHAEAGDVICSPECWKKAGRFFGGEPVGGANGPNSEYYKVQSVQLPIKLCSRRPSFTRDDTQLHARMKQYVPRAVWPYLHAHDEFWGSELRDVTVLFINLGFCEKDLATMLGMPGLQRLQDAFALVQKCIYEYEGTINKFLVDDKGSTVIAAFGLPPVTHENDPIRGILASLAICAALGNMDLKASVGITTGAALCGVVGHQGNRREYTVLGDIVNLSARLMQRAKSEKGGVITDEATKNFTQDTLHFEERPEIMVKGKNDSIKIHRPYPRMSILMEFHLSQTGAGATTPTLAVGANLASQSRMIRPVIPMRNVMENMHRIQVRDAQRRLSRRAGIQAASRPSIVESDSFARIRDDLLEHCSQLNPFSPGGAFVLEGDIGVGKTFLLNSALGGPEAGAYNVLHGTACPFSTDKPYAIWAEIITKCALDQSTASPKDSSSSASDDTNSLCSPSSATSVGSISGNNQLPGAGCSQEVERRRRVARFVRRKINEGAAPNTTLVRYTHLLDSVLETNFSEYGDADEDTSNHFSMSGNGNRNVKLFGSNVESLRQSGDKEGDSGDLDNQDEDHDAASEAETSDFPSPGASSPGKLLKVKEDEIAAWFLNLLEMDLMQKEEARASLASPSSTITSGSRRALRTRVESEWRPADLDLSGILLLCALFAISRDKSTVFCLDNAMYMDEKSWILTAIVVKYFTNCIVVVGTRPPSLALNENTESSSFRKQLRALKQMNSSVCHVLDPLRSNKVDELARHILQVQHIPPELAEVFVSRSQGNPLFLSEIIGDMERQRAIRVDTKRHTCQMQVQEPWGDKSNATCCFYCNTDFTKDKDKDKDKEKHRGKEKQRVKDKHRCKCCGYIFCAACTPKACRKKLPGTTGDTVRHCCSCYTISSTRRASADRSYAAAAGALSGGLGGNVPARHKSRMRSIFQTSDHVPTKAAAHALKNRVALRPPRTIKSILTTMLDQLTVSQRMLMKTASAIGAVFDEELLRGANPIEAHLSRFEEDVDELERLAMIRRIDTFIGGVPGGPNGSTRSSSSSSSSGKTPSLKVKFEFAHGFMQDVLRAQMLCVQLDKLTARVADVREQQQKELRHKFFEKANVSLSRSPLPLTISVTPTADTTSGPGHALINGVRRVLTPPRRGPRSPPRNSPAASSRPNGRLVRSSSHSSLDRHSTASTTNVLQLETNSSTDVRESGDDSIDLLAEYEYPPRVLGGLAAAVVPHPLAPLHTARALPQSAFMRLKSGRVFVKKRSSVFAHLKFTGLANGRLWKTRFAVLQSARLLLQYDEDEDAQVGGAEAGASLFLQGAKVSACDPEVAAKVNCFQLEVDQWTKGRYLRSERRVFVIGVQNDEEVEDWVYMVRYAIEALENQSQTQRAA